MTRVVLWDVDTQVDFMLPPGEALRSRRRAASSAWPGWSTRPRTAGVVHVASADDHELTDPEISDAPDFGTPIRPTACAGRRAPRRSPRPSRSTRSRSPIGRFRSRLQRLVAGRREILLLKKSFDVFTNPNTEALLELLDPERDGRLRRRHRRLRRRGDRGPDPASAQGRVRRRCAPRAHDVGSSAAAGWRSRVSSSRPASTLPPSYCRRVRSRAPRELRLVEEGAESLALQAKRDDAACGVDLLDRLRRDDTASR